MHLTATFQYIYFKSKGKVAFVRTIDLREVHFFHLKITFISVAENSKLFSLLFY